MILYALYINISETVYNIGTQEIATLRKVITKYYYYYYYYYYYQEVVTAI